MYYYDTYGKLHVWSTQSGCTGSYGTWRVGLQIIPLMADSLALCAGRMHPLHPLAGCSNYSDVHTMQF